MSLEAYVHAVCKSVYLTCDILTHSLNRGSVTQVLSQVLIFMHKGTRVRLKSWNGGLICLCAVNCLSYVVGLALRSSNGGLLVYLGPSDGGDGGDYLVVYLTAKGNVTLQYNLGGGDQQFEGMGVTNDVYTDGLLHTVLVQRTQNEAVLTVNGIQTPVTATGMYAQPHTQWHSEYYHRLHALIEILYFAFKRAPYIQLYYKHMVTTYEDWHCRKLELFL